MSQDMTNATPTSGTPEPAPTRPARARIIGLDGVRGVLCLMVAVTHVTGHYSPKTAGTWHTNVFGFSLVYFFVLSGFLISLPFIRNLVKDRAAYPAERHRLRCTDSPGSCLRTC